MIALRWRYISEQQTDQFDLYDQLPNDFLFGIGATSDKMRVVADTQDIINQASEYSVQAGGVLVVSDLDIFVDYTTSSVRPPVLEQSHSMKYAGTYRVSVDLDGGGITARVYVNGRAVWPERTDNSGSGTLVSFSTDITIEADDTIQLYTYTPTIGFGSAENYSIGVSALPTFTSSYNA